MYGDVKKLTFPSLLAAYVWTICLSHLMLLDSGFPCEGLDFQWQSTGSDLVHVLKGPASVPLSAALTESSHN